MGRHGMKQIDLQKYKDFVEVVTSDQSNDTESLCNRLQKLEHETNVNDNKRNINILRTEYLNFFLESFEEIMEYKPSKQFVTDSLKKTENPRLISP